MTISQVGAATGTTSCTVPAHNIGDLIVIYAYRSGSTTAPSLPAGYISISTRAGTTCSARLGFKIATATNDASGTWTNATNLTCVVYTSSQRTTGGALYVGTGGAVSSGTTTTVTFPAVTMAHADNTSWVAGFSGISIATAAMSTHAPSGMTFFTGSDVTSTVEVTAFDTNGTVSSWASTNSTASNAGNWTTATLEIIENQPGAGIPANIVQSVYTAANAVISTASGNNFAIPLPNATLSGNGLVLAVSYPGTATPAITDDKGNTWPASGAAGTVTAASGDQNLQMFRLASATAGTKTITVGFGATVVQPVKIWIWELVNITGTVNGTVQAANLNTLGVVSPGAFTPSNNNANGGNLIIAVACCANGTSSANPSLILPESNYTLTDGDITWSGTQGNPSASQSLLQATSAATTPQFYFEASGTQQYNAVAMALSVGVQGTQKPAGIHIDAIRYLSCAGNPASLKIQIPSSGNLGVTTGFSFSGTNALPDLTAIVDSDGTSWQRIDPSPNNTPVFYHNPNQTPKSYRTATLTLGGGTGLPMQVVYYDISGAATSPLGATGFQQFPTLNGSNTASAASVITAQATNGLILGFIQLGLGPSTTISSPAGAFADLPTYDTATGTGSITTTTMTISATTWGAFGGANNLVVGPNVTVGTSIVSGAGPFTINPSQTAASGAITQKQFDSDTMSFGNFAGHYYNGSDVSAQTWTVNITNQSTATGGNLTVAEFKAAPVAASLVGPLMVGGSPRIALRSRSPMVAPASIATTTPVSLFAAISVSLNANARATGAAAIAARISASLQTRDSATGKVGLAALTEASLRTQAQPRGAVGLSAQTRIDLTQAGAETGKLALSALVMTQAKALAQPSGTLSISAQLAIKTFGRAGPSGSVHMAALIGAQVKLQDGPLSLPLSLRAAINAQLKTRAELAGIVPVQASITAKFTSQPQISTGGGGTVSLSARIQITTFVAPRLTGAAALSALATIAGRATSTPSGAAPMRATITAQFRMQQQPSGSAPLRTIIFTQLTGASRLAGVLGLSAAVTSQFQARQQLGGNTNLAARVNIQVQPGVFVSPPLSNDLGDHWRPFFASVGKMTSS